jgi:hypothetical protein
MRIEIDFKNVQEDTLAELCVALENSIPGCEIKSQEIYILETNSPKAASILHSLFSGNNTQVAETEKKEKKEKKPKKEKSKQTIRTMNFIPYTFLDGPRSGQTITGGALGRMLKAGNLAAGARLSHPRRGELVVVTNGQGTFTLQAVPA